MSIVPVNKLHQHRHLASKQHCSPSQSYFLLFREECICFLFFFKQRHLHLLSGQPCDKREQKIPTYSKSKPSSWWWNRLMWLRCIRKTGRRWIIGGSGHATSWWPRLCIRSKVQTNNTCKKKDYHWYSSWNLVGGSSINYNKYKIQLPVDILTTILSKAKISFSFIKVCSFFKTRLVT